MLKNVFLLVFTLDRIWNILESEWESKLKIIGNCCFLCISYLLQILSRWCRDMNDTRAREVTFLIIKNVTSSLVLISSSLLFALGWRWGRSTWRDWIYIKISRIQSAGRKICQNESTVTLGVFNVIFTAVNDYIQLCCYFPKTKRINIRMYAIIQVRRINQDFIKKYCHILNHAATAPLCFTCTII